MTQRLRVAVIGESGQLASNLIQRLSAGGFDVVVLARPAYDLTRSAEISIAIARARPDVVINPAAYTAVDKAEDEPDLAYAINRDGAEAIASAAAMAGAAIVHVSTDYVFNGRSATPCTEADPTDPQSVYGASKLAGELAVAAANPRHVIIRTAWVFSATGSNFVKTMLRLAAERPALRVVNDQRGSPTSASDLAQAIVSILPTCAAAAPPVGRYGVFHAVNGGETSWCGFAQAIMAGSAARGGPHVPVHAIATSEYPTKARRPAYSRLATAKLEQAYGVSLRPWEAALSDCLDQLIGPVRPAVLDEERHT